MTRQYSIEALGQHLGSIWADNVQMGGELGSDAHMCFVIGGEPALVLTMRPGLIITSRDEAGQRIELTPDSIRAANQREACGTAQ